MFKRDSFTCKYCGKSAPEVVLEVDHIDPVKNGGDNSLLNLITSCHDCNRGKGARKLSDTQVIDKQMDQLKDLNEKRLQMKQMLEWKKELDNLLEEQIGAINDLMVYKNKELTEVGKKDFKKWIKEFGFSEVFESFQISLDQYADKDGISKAISFTPRICESRKQSAIDPMYHKRNYLRKVIMNKYRMNRTSRIEKILFELCTNEEIADKIILIAKRSRLSDEFYDNLNESFEGNW